MNKNLIQRVADRHEKKAKIEQIDGKFKRVSPIIGTWLETVISKLDSLENVLGYAEKIATKEHKRLESLVKKKYGYSDNFEDDDYEDPLVQAFIWVDGFWGEVWTGGPRSNNPFQRKVEEARLALEQTIYDVNSWGSYATRMASANREADYMGINFAKAILLRLFKERHADYTHDGWVFHTELPVSWEKMQQQTPRLLKDWKQGRGYEDEYEATMSFESKNTYIQIIWNKKNNKVKVVAGER